MTREPNEWLAVLSAEDERVRPLVREALEEFWGAERREPSTSRLHRAAACRFLAFVGRHGFGLTQLGPAFLQRYLDQHVGSSRSKARQLAVMWLLYEALVRRRVREVNPADYVRV